VEVFKLDKPNISGKIKKVFDLISSSKDFLPYVARTNKPEYLFWDKVSYKPRPKGITAEEFWALIKFLRRNSPSRVKTVVRDEYGDFFTWQPVPELDYFLHEVDMQLGGVLESSVIDDQMIRQRFISRGIMEEAIASSQLEGANTTRKAAKRMILERRKPANQSEQMILNNYQTMVVVEERLRNQSLSMDLLLELHVTLTRDTINALDVGRLRRDKDEVVVIDPATNMIYHIPPSEKFLKREIKRFLAYANDEAKEHQFVHPVIKAIILHFWIGYLHPFTDGNGRLARTIFYWYLLRKQYWAFTYLPLSRVIKNSPAQYRDAYIYSEQDDNDLTYFVDYNIRKIAQAKRDFELYMRRKQSENRKMADVARSKYHLNDRQIQLLRYFHKNPGARATIKTHSHVYGVSRMTARKDLKYLEHTGFLKSQKIGREVPFSATDKTSELFS
jgi:Fic family protein